MSGKIFERFWPFCNLPQGVVVNISANVISRLSNILLGAHDKRKLIENVMVVHE